MKVFSLQLVCLVAYSLLLSSPAAQAQQGTMKWRFTARSQVVPALEKTRGNLRATYDVLLCARRQGYGRSTVEYYSKIVGGQIFSASVQDSIAFVYACEINDGFRPWNWRSDTDPTLGRNTSRSQVYSFRQRALELGGHLPEVLLMSSYGGMWLDMEEKGKSYHRLLKATKRASGWADAHYWLAQAAVNYGFGYQTRISRDNLSPKQIAEYRRRYRSLGALAMRSLDRAGKLDPGLRPYLYFTRMDALELIETKKSASLIPVYAKAHVKALPEFATYYRKRWNKPISAYFEKKNQVARYVLERANQQVLKPKS